MDANRTLAAGSFLERRNLSSSLKLGDRIFCRWLSQLNLPNPPEVQIIIHENVAQAILQAARLYDLVVFPYIRNRTSPGGLATHDVTTQLARQLTCSIIILGEPPAHPTTVVQTGIPNPQFLNI